MSLGVCCQWLIPKPNSKIENTINATNERSLQKGRYFDGKYSTEYIEALYLSNIAGQTSVVQRLIDSDIKVWRLSSSLLPLFDFCKEIALNSESINDALAHLGRLYLDNSIRVSTHPGQYTVLSSDSASVIANSIAELEYHAWVFDRLGLPRTHHYPINIHGGKKDRKQTLISSINSLSEGVKSRLTLENDERCYSTADLFEVSQQTHTPIVWDSHHHTFNDASLTMVEAIDMANSTWNGHKPLQHISNSEPGTEGGGFTERRKHSYHIHYIPEAQLEVIKLDTVDVEVEAKGKNLAVLKMREQFGIK